MLDNSYLTDSRDRIILGETPTLMQPLYGDLAPPDLHKHRFVIARNGVFLQCRTPTLSVCVRVTENLFEFPYGPLAEKVELIGGPLNRSLYDKIQEHAIAASPSEWACLVVWDGRQYALSHPEVFSASRGHIQYRNEHDPENLVLDLHTHGEGKGNFSSTDNASDSEGGCYLASVLGHCQSAGSMTITTRIVVNGLFYPVSWSPFLGTH